MGKKFSDGEMHPVPVTGSTDDKLVLVNLNQLQNWMVEEKVGRLIEATVNQAIEEKLSQFEEKISQLEEKITSEMCDRLETSILPLVPYLFKDYVSSKLLDDIKYERENLRRELADHRKVIARSAINSEARLIAIADGKESEVFKKAVKKAVAVELGESYIPAEPEPLAPELELTTPEVLAEFAPQPPDSIESLLQRLNAYKQQVSESVYPEAPDLKLLPQPTIFSLYYLAQTLGFKTTFAELQRLQAYAFATAKADAFTTSYFNEPKETAEDLYLNYSLDYFDLDLSRRRIIGWRSSHFPEDRMGKAAYLDCAEHAAASVLYALNPESKKYWEPLSLEEAEKALEEQADRLALFCENCILTKNFDKKAFLKASKARLRDRRRRQVL